MGRSIMISNATNPLKESRKESLLRCAGSTSICVWLVCDLVVMSVQAVDDRALGDLCVCVRCGSVQSQKVWDFTTNGTLDLKKSYHHSLLDLHKPLVVNVVVSGSVRRGRGGDRCSQRRS